MMDYDEMRAAVLDALDEHARKQEENAPRFGAMLPVAPFDAETFEDERCQVVGMVVGTGGDFLEFVVIKELESGELIPTTEGSLWRRKDLAALNDATHAATPTELAKDAGMKEGNVKYLLRQMVKAGEIEKVGSGQYKLAGR